MCGIAGIYNFSENPIERKALQAMSLSLIHRGPDGVGEHIEKNIGITNRRLAIIDPTKAGDQPISTRDGNYWITFNGEIFNYKSIREKLVKKGYKFRSHTDTETILNGYIEYGEEIFSKLIGQFAICIWDKKQEKFILARDHMGVNPLYYHIAGERFLFASELKGLLASGYVRRDIDPQALHHYLSVFTIPAPLTLIRGVHSLLPGRILTVDKSGMKIKKFWDLPIGNWQSEKWNISDVKDKLRQMLISSVAYAKESDVPVGAFLSGGIDSSTVVALLAQQSTKPVHTYSLWAEGGETYDERKYARQVAQRYQTNHHEIMVSQDEMYNELLKIIYYFDQPTGGSTENYFVSKAAAKDVKVALSGLGGDELFAGYHSHLYKMSTASMVYRQVPMSLRLLGISMLKKLPLSVDTKKTVQVANNMLNLPNMIKQRLYLHYSFHEEEKHQLYSDEMKELVGITNTKLYFEELTRRVTGMHPIDQLSYLDLSSYTRDDLLLGVNMMTMANSLEARVPLMDPRLVEFASHVPPEMKYKNGVTKYVLREVVKEWLPDEVLSHKKTGFGLPRIMYMNGKLKPAILKALSKESVEKRGFFNYPAVKQEVHRFYNDTSTKRLWSEHLRVWSLFVLELWCRMYLDQPMINPPAQHLGDLF
jgi:asparagine synthase (glutamine-hydrolysing)